MNIQDPLVVARARARSCVAVMALVAACSGDGDGGPASSAGPEREDEQVDADTDSSDSPRSTTDPGAEDDRGSAGDGGDGGGGNGGSPGVEPPAERGAALLSLRSCSDVEQAVRSAALRAMNDLLDEQLASVLGQLDNGQCWFRGRGILDIDTVFAGGAFGGLGGGGLPAAPAAASAPSDVSETNNQVSGVDEPDLVKNDDRFLYVVAQGALHVIEAWPAAQAKQVARVPLADTPKRLLLHGDRLLVFSSVPRASAESAAYQPWFRYGGGECTYGYDCDFTGDGNGTRISVFDVTNRAAPALLRTIETRATFISARRIGSAVHTVLYDEPELLRTLPIYPAALQSGGTLCTGAPGTQPGQPVPTPADRMRVEQLFAELRAANVAAIEAAPLDALLSKIADQRGTEQTCAGFYDSPQADGTAFLSLVSFDVARDEPLQTSTIVSRPGASYASGDAYYISVRQQHSAGFGWFGALPDADEASTLHKFELAGSSNRYAASGVVKGRVLNQFSLDEYQGNLRVATTSGHLPSPEAHSTVSVLAQRGAELQLVGQVDQIAPTEDVRSVRFVGERGYLVTFKKTDPLFVVDLARPAAPALLGELKIPGFSTYMHPLDAGHLLTIGYDADDQGSFAWFQGLTLQIFDVTTPTDPQLAQKLVIGTRGSSSEAATNHLAFNYFAPRQTLAVPITVCEGGSGSSYGAMTFSGLQLYRVDVGAGFMLRGGVNHPYVDPYSDAQFGVGSACSSWWTQARSVVKRTVFMDDFVYSISDLRVKVSDLRDLSRDLADIALRAD